jgi:hypothetical protein
MSERLTIAKRMVIALLTLGAVFGALWILLPAVRGLTLPAAVDGGWVIGPVRALRFGACTVLSALTVPFLLRPLGQEWRRRDLATRGAPLDPLPRGSRAPLLVQGGLLFVVYALGAAFYFLSYTEVTPERITIHSPLGARAYGYGAITALERVARRGEETKHAIHFDDDSWGYFGVDNEGLSPREVSAIAEHVARASGRSWVDVER